jgi:2-polyprenyl-3-methyl-5-hydroxy-6-metoxy-1,4-benzoquinol methylase/rRNA maturation protein Nop10
VASNSTAPHALQSFADCKLETLAACPLCDAASHSDTPVAAPPPFGLRQCGACGIVFVSPRPANESMKDTYDEYYEPRESPAPPARQVQRGKRHARRLTQFAGTPGRLLDVGAGDGYLVHAAKELGWNVEGLEFSVPRIQRAKRWFDVDLQRHDLFEAPFEKQSFDALTMFQLIEHVHDPRALIQRAGELLRPGGLLAMSTPNVLTYRRKKRGVETWKIPIHLFFFSPRTLVELVERCGFTVVRRSLKRFAQAEKLLGWQPWDDTSLIARSTCDLLTPFGLHLVARKN